MRALKDKTILDILRCPICGSGMRVYSESGVSLKCEGARTHCYDLASSGYVNLCAPSQSGGGDSKQAVGARRDFLNKDFYRPVAEAISDAVCKYADRADAVIDAGCGEGYYSSMIAERSYSVFGVDLSKFAVDAASKRVGARGIDNAFFATASVFSLPVADSSAGALTNIFAPCAEEEYSRVLKDGGVLIVAWAGEEHLMGLKRVLYKETHANTERADLPVNMEKIDEIRVRYDIELTDNKDIMSLFSMTPYYWRTSADDASKLADTDRLRTEVDIIISVYKNKKSAEVSI